ncbi:hypothetical protein NSA50_07800 [Clostridium sp. DSM 100503]|uniref:hypothetical protein n=1 Tax=Clostridium sp. DSM 100503 TaxID=2963282 RepID=UPI002149A6EB|nr:hypothetical protein [Clostridium sp. DSM 100503]MCR1950965.1 hypothetical protein [Clostridium sp. DSM 100503]
MSRIESSAATNEVQPRALICDYGGTFSGQTTSYTPWAYIGQATYQDNSYYIFKKYSITKITTYRCNR